MQRIGTSAILFITMLTSFWVALFNAQPVSAAEFSTANTSNCNDCHAKYSDAANSRVLATKHTAAGLDCFSCHEKSKLEAAHQDKTKMPGHLIRRRKYPNEFCLNCHGTYEGLVEKTKGSKVFTALDGKVINPHAVDASVTSEEHNKKECYTCHKMHDKAQPIDYCYGCHHPRQLNSCKDCHSKGK